MLDFCKTCERFLNKGCVLDIELSVVVYVTQKPSQASFGEYGVYTLKPHFEGFLQAVDFVFFGQVNKVAEGGGNVMNVASKYIVTEKLCRKGLT